MTTPGVRRPLNGGTVGERIDDALAQKGWTRQRLAKELGTRWQTVDDWISGKHEPRRFLRRIAEVLDVTTDELLGVAEGQDPPFAAWPEFLATDEGRAMTEDELRMLRSIAWPRGRAPTVGAYLAVLVAARMTAARA
jgi:transcriptional regulator with XRE-family HTH domain